MKVKLTPSELYLAASVGLMRQCTNLRDRKRNRFGAEPGQEWSIHIEGSCAEAAVAKALNTYWNGAIGHHKAKDVGVHQVRSTPRDDGSLILHKEDPDEDLFILVTGTAPNYELRGWIQCFEGKDQRFWRADRPRPAFFVPQEDLHPLAAMGQS
jgi:hypothetical protein|tara:strand:- start:2792 stop:3253 length:462 start_codon:yes stop_codon:yes gene_type:complete